MNKSEKGNILIVVLGAIILGVFMPVSLINMANSDEYYYSTDIIESINYANGKLEVITREDMVAVCIKETKTEPALDSLCWKNTTDSRVETSIYEYKTYHIWTKDSNDVISYYAKYNTNS